MTAPAGLGAVLLAVVALVGRDLVAGQTFRAGVDAVRVDVLVTADGRPVTGLAASDVELRDNGVVQEIRTLDVEDVPVTLTMVLDVSESVEGEPLAHLRGAIIAADEALSADDRLSLVTFSDRLDLQGPASEDRARVRERAQAVKAGGATALYDATLAALLMRPRIEGRMVMLVFSDGGDTSSWLDPRTVITAAQRSDVVIYGVTLRQQVEQRNLREARQNQLERDWFNEVPASFGRHFLPLLAEDTGGSVLVAERSDRLRQTFVRVISEFKSRYVLSYTPSGVEQGGWHPIEVRLRGRRGDVTARRGYLRAPR
ncbi:MAG: VWA domain-containing protein [Vicinamibacterales bacterium]